MWVMRKGQWIANYIRKSYDTQDVSRILSQISDEKYADMERMYLKYLHKHIHPSKPSLFCSSPQLDTRCTCSWCTSKYEKRLNIEHDLDQP